MRNLFIIGILIAGASMAGWFSVNREGDRTTIEFDRTEIREDTRNVFNRARGYLEDGQAAPNDQNQWADPNQQGNLPQDQIAQQPQWQQPQQWQQQQQSQWQQQPQNQTDPRYAPAQPSNQPVQTPGGGYYPRQ